MLTIEDLNKYLDNIFNKINELDGTFISLRLWVKNKYNNKIIKKLFLTKRKRT